ncbi:thermostable hemolysin [Streptomyces afghaniensis]|uniref:thermostable hemolysin n=1 Tax=Streptomyces afghaniensis TaxID=66865 RepID=UPI00277FAC6B|nr:thermostable hemolysin [Streptomyces afghaniensis]MDQ1018916.1 hypothetical protein [Streptomyces afghaniensis]
MALGVVARKESPLWRAAAQLTRNIYRTEYGAEIDPRPDLFGVLQRGAGEQGSVVDGAIDAAAGLTIGGERPFMADYYMDDSAESVLTSHLGVRLRRAQIVEVGPLASVTLGGGARLCSVIPGLARRNGARVIMCTVTARLGSLFSLLGIEFTPLAPAEESALPRRLQGGWGTYYASEPVTGYIDIRSVAPQLTAPEPGLIRAATDGVVL